MGTLPRLSLGWILHGCWLLGVGMALTLAPATPLAATPTDLQGMVSLDPGGIARTGAIATLALKPGEIGVNALQMPDGTLIPLQPDADDTQARFILPTLASRQQVLARLIRHPGTFTNALQFSKASQGKASTLSIAALTADGASAECLGYPLDPKALPRPGIDPVYGRAGYLHPLVTPSGAVVTDDYPANHLHHHGFWMAWRETRFQGRKPNFWEMGAKSGTVEILDNPIRMEGPTWTGFRTRHRYRDLSVTPPVDALYERWEVRVYSPTPGLPQARIVDVDCLQEAALAEGLDLPKYLYGGMAIRGRGEWNGAANALVLTSEGVTNRVTANSTTNRWCYLGGIANGKTAGVAVLSHPTNFRAPQPVRVHPEEPYFSFAPCHLEGFSIRPGQPFRVSYRLLLLDGPPDRDWIEARWRDYAQPVLVRRVMP